MPIAQYEIKWKKHLQNKTFWFEVNVVRRESERMRGRKKQCKKKYNFSFLVLAFNKKPVCYLVIFFSVLFSLNAPSFNSFFLIFFCLNFKRINAKECCLFFSFDCIFFVRYSLFSLRIQWTSLLETKHATIHDN